MKINWIEDNGDARDELGRFDIEQAGENLFWSFMDGKPVGTYSHMDKAKARCEALLDGVKDNG